MQDQGCKSGQDNRRSDLCAQWKAADAARASADAAWLLGLIGLGIGALTLLAASRAAHWAKAAAFETRRSANIANNALIADTRAWLAIKWVAPHIVGDPPGDEAVNVASRIALAVHNYGRGPALDCEARVGWKRRGEAWERLDEAPYCRTTRIHALMPGESNETVVVNLDDPFDEIFLNGMLMLWVEVSYRVVGAEGRRCTIQHLRVGVPHAGGGISVVGKGYVVRGHRLIAVPDKTTMT